MITFLKKQLPNLGLPFDLLEPPGASWGLLELPRISWDHWGLLGPPGTSWELPGVSWDLLGISLGVLELPGACWSLLESPQKLGNLKMYENVMFFSSFGVVETKKHRKQIEKPVFPVGFGAQAP